MMTLEDIISYLKSNHHLLLHEKFTPSTEFKESLKNILNSPDKNVWEDLFVPYYDWLIAFATFGREIKQQEIDSALKRYQWLLDYCQTNFPNEFKQALHFESYVFQFGLRESLEQINKMLFNFGVVGSHPFIIIAREIKKLQPKITIGEPSISDPVNSLFKKWQNSNDELTANLFLMLVLDVNKELKKNYNKLIEKNLKFLTPVVQKILRELLNNLEDETQLYLLRENPELAKKMGKNPSKEPVKNDADPSLSYDFIDNLILKMAREKQLTYNRDTSGQLREFGIPLTATIRTHIEEFSKIDETRGKILEEKVEVVNDSRTPVITYNTFKPTKFKPKRKPQIINTPTTSNTTTSSEAGPINNNSLLNRPRSVYSGNNPPAAKTPPNPLPARAPQVTDNDISNPGENVNSSEENLVTSFSTQGNPGKQEQLENKEKSSLNTADITQMLQEASPSSNPTEENLQKLESSSPSSNNLDKSKDYIYKGTIFETDAGKYFKIREQAEKEKQKPQKPSEPTKEDAGQSLEHPADTSPGTF